MAAITNAAEYPYFFAIEPAANELMPTNRSTNALTEPRSFTSLPRSIVPLATTLRASTGKRSARQQRNH
jgi:hypothetical protein